MQAAVRTQAKTGRNAALTLAATNRGTPAAAQSPRECAGVLRIKAYVEASLDDPGLSPFDIARALGISVRHAHRLFGQTGSSLGRWILGRRLARCAADLRDPARACESLTQIAFRWGFNDSAHFSRAFRAAYDQTPRGYRAAHALTVLRAGALTRQSPAGTRPCL